jgi:xylose isomerase
VSYAIDNGIFGSIDANRGDPQNGWDTDQFPNSVEEMSLAMFEILEAGGFGPNGVATGGFNFDTKLRRQSLDRTDLFHGHIGGIDTLAQSLLVAEALIADGSIGRFRTERYSGWTGDLGRAIGDVDATLAGIADRATDQDLAPEPVSGRQEFLENDVNRVIWETT